MTLRPSLNYDWELSTQQDKFSEIPEMVAQRRFVRAALRLKDGERVAEVGCGNGRLACEMAGDVGDKGQVVGADISPDMVNLAQALCAKSGSPQVKIVTADAKALPFPDATFDAAAVVQCFCLVSDVNAAIAELFRVLRPGGRAVILDTDWDTLMWNSADPALMARMASVYTAVYTDARLPRRLSKLLRGAGFIVLSRAVFPIVNRQFEPESFSGYQIGFSRMIGKTIVPPAEFDAWVRSIEATATDGTYFFSLDRHLFSIEKPGAC